MVIRIVLIVLTVAALTAGGCKSGPELREVPADDPALGRLAWMSGSWVRELDGNTSEELWTTPRGGSMLGVNRTIEGGKLMFFEYLRIESTPEGIVYIASPKGRRPTTFRLVEEGPQRAVFENPTHDFPQRIIYWREGPLLSARIEGEQRGQMSSDEWQWERGRIAVR